MRGRARSPHFPGGREKVPAAAICPLPSALSVLPLLHPQLLLTRLVHEVHELGAGEASGGPRHLLEVCRQAEGRQAGRQNAKQGRWVKRGAGRQATKRPGGCCGGHLQDG